MSVVLPFVISMVFTMALMPLLLKIAAPLGLVDEPDHRKIHAVRIPRVGGIAIAAGALAATLFSRGSFDSEEVLFLASSGIIFVFGVLDDRFNLDFKIKFSVQFAACFFLVIGGSLEIHSLTLPEPIEIPRVVGIALAVFYLVGVTNAVNLSDGLDGLAGGTAFLCLCGLSWLCYSANQFLALALCVGLAGAVLGFLRFNTFPAIVFMGDAGSQLLGFAIGAIGLLATQKSVSPLSASLPVLLLGVPILDTLQVMIRRLIAGTSPFKPDKMHLHHRLLGLGLAHHQAVMIIYALQIVLFLVAYLERFQFDSIIIATYVTFAFLCLFCLGFSERRGWKLGRSGESLPRRSGSIGSWLVSDQARSIFFSLLVSAFVGFGLLLLSEKPVVATDVRFAVVASVVVMIFQATVRRGSAIDMLDKGCLYAIVAAFVFSDVSVINAVSWAPRLDWILVVLVALSSVLTLRATTAKKFGITGLDLLILFVTLVVPNLPDLDLLPGFVPMLVAKLVVLSYGLEVILADPSVSAQNVRLMALVASGSLAVRLLFIS